MTCHSVYLTCRCVFQCLLWNVEQAEPVNVVDCHTDTIFSIAWSRDGSLFATTSKDKKLRVIDPRTASAVAVSSTACGDSGRSWCDGALDPSFMVDPLSYSSFQGARCSSVLRAFPHGVMGRLIDPSWGGPIELFLVPARGARCSSVVRAFTHGAMGCRINPSWGGPIELFLFPRSEM